MWSKSKRSESEGDTALHCSCIHKASLDIIQLLVSKGAGSNMKNLEGRLPLDLARAHRARCFRQRLPDMKIVQHNAPR